MAFLIYFTKTNYLFEGSFFLFCYFLAESSGLCRKQSWFTGWSVYVGRQIDCLTKAGQCAGPREHPPQSQLPIFGQRIWHRKIPVLFGPLQGKHIVMLQEIIFRVSWSRSFSLVFPLQLTRFQATVRLALNGLFPLCEVSLAASTMSAVHEKDSSCAFREDVVLAAPAWLWVKCTPLYVVSRSVHRNPLTIEGFMKNVLYGFDACLALCWGVMESILR